MSARIYRWSMTTPNSAEPVVTVHLWGVRNRAIPGSLIHMATDRRRVRKSHGLQFAKLIGTGSGATFSLRDADPHHWGLISVWTDEADARVFELGSVVTDWDHRSFERARFVLRPIHSRGSWAGVEPFGPGHKPTDNGPVASITRARISARHWRKFATAVPPVAADSVKAPGLLLSTGIGEAPFGLQGTFSVWSDATALNGFAGGPAHQRVVDDTSRIRWYSEELFARFAVLQSTGSFCGKPVDFDHDAA